jgi:hypothetical protein
MKGANYNDLKNLCTAINKQVKRLGGSVGYEIGHRYDYYAIDQVNLKTGGISDTFRAGLTKSQCDDILYAVSKVLDSIEFNNQKKET